MSVLSPIAVIAMTIKNLLSVLSGRNSSFDTPIDIHIVVTILARRKYIINLGNALLKLKEFSLLFSFLALFTAKAKVIGIIASVLVSLTVTALSSVCVPR